MRVVCPADLLALPWDALIVRVARLVREVRPDPLDESVERRRDGLDRLGCSTSRSSHSRRSVAPGDRPRRGGQTKKRPFRDRSPRPSRRRRGARQGGASRVRIPDLATVWDLTQMALGALTEPEGQR